jgi:hypothetical protein
MHQGSGGLSAIAIIAVLFLLSFGFVAYAVPGVGAAPVAGDSSTAAPSNDPSRLIYFHLVATAPDAQSPNASGYAGISVSGGSLSIEWSISGGSPGEQLTMTMLSASSTGESRSFNFSSVQVSQQGTAGATESATLDQGDYSVGLKVVGSTSGASPTVFVSDPATAQVTVASSQASTVSTAVGDALSYALVPLPVYLHQDTPSGYPFKEGGALIVVSGDTLRVTISFLGSPDTTFTSVIQTPDRNVTVGGVTTTSIGGGVFKGNVTLNPGTYQVGLLLFVSGKADTPVAVSVPKALRVTLGSPNTTSSTGSSTESSSGHSITESSGTSTSASTSTGASLPPQTANQLEFVPITTTAAHEGYSYGQGRGGYAVTGGSVAFSLAFTGQNPKTHYSLTLSVNGTARTIGEYTTDAHGEGHVGATAELGTGSFALSLTVVDLSSFDRATAVLSSVPSSFTVLAHAGSTSTSTTQATTSSSSEGGTPRGHEWSFKLTPSNVENVPSGYRFASSGTAMVSLDPEHSLLDVEIGFQDANPSTTYTAALVLNGTTVSLGTMTTSRGGGAVLHSSVQADPGTYLLGVVVFDVSNMGAFHADAPVPVLVSSPSTQLAAIGAPNGEPSSSSTASSSTGATSHLTASQVTRAATTISAGTEVRSQIQDAVDNLTIPATVQVTPLQSSTTVLDSRFSLSVGQQVGNGLVIAISGENVTGPRVLLINMSRTAPLSLYPALNVTLDGVPVAEASSALQVLNPVSTNPPLYVLVSTSDSIQLLVSIPHFSLHLIQVAGVIVQSVVRSLELDAPILLGSIIVISLAFAAAYAARKRYFSILI